MTRGHLIVGLDIGTRQIKVLAALFHPKNKKMEVVGQAEVENDRSAMRKGVVINPEAVALKIKEVIDSCQENSPLKLSLRRVRVNLSGSHLVFLPSRGLVSVSRADQRISESDQERALQASRNLSLSANQEIFDTFPQEFIIDGQPGVKEALGLRGIHLEARTLCLAVFSPYLKNLSQAILEAGLEAENVIPSVLVSSLAVLTAQEKETGVALLEIGAGNTNLAVFEEGSLAHAVVLPLGSDNITQDVAIVLKTELETAERIKKEFSGLLSRRLSGKKVLAKVIVARVKEIFGQVQQELKKAGRTRLPSGIVLTGGGAKLPGLVDFAKRELKLPCRLGLPQGFSPELEDLSLATVAGLVLDGRQELEKEKDRPIFERGLLAKIKGLINSFLP